MENEMERTEVNPWQWSLAFGYNQGEVVNGDHRTLYLAGQTACNENGEPQHAGDMRAQVSLALDNVEAVLTGAGMTLGNLIRLNMYVTDLDAFFGAFDILGKRLGGAGVKPPGTLLEIKRLAFPGLMVELEGTAVA